jgi:Tol biopolymer transport system component
MPLSAGDKLGPYEILAPLGAGGMGEVYRARDSKLNRDVAIKVLPAVLAGDGQYMARFEREAQLLAALNHPNIATVYGIEQGALVMELVEGGDLKGPLPLEECSAIARQIAAGLEAAHEKGIIHRDLKPANIKLTPAGVVKILDFGLAKSASASSAASASNATISPTLSLAMTEAGMILGTAAYMSPEQARGKNVDKRADIWSFGVVFYEMLTGRQLFGGGETVTDTLASVVKDTPDLSKLPASTPRNVRRLIERCLRKDPNTRLRDIGEARLALDEPELAEVRDPGPAEARATRMIPWAVAAVSILALAGVLIYHATRPVPMRPLIRLNAEISPDLPLARNSGAAIALSLDGTRLALTLRGADGKARLYTRLLNQNQVTLLAGTEGAYFPFFSPDGQSIGFGTGGMLKKISVEGGATVTLCDAPNFRGAVWTEDGNIVAALTNRDVLSRVPAAGGTPVPLTKFTPGEISHRWPHLLPDGQTVLFTGNNRAGIYDDATIDAVSVKTGERKTVRRGGYSPHYIPPAGGAGSGHLIYQHRSTLFAVPFDPGRLETTGAPAALLEDVNGNIIAGGEFVLAQNGTFVYLPGKAALGLSISSVDRSGKIEPLYAPLVSFASPRFSPDGKRLAFSSATAEGEDIWVKDLDRDAPSRLSFLPGQNRWPVWTPDGKNIVFRSTNANAPGMYWIRSDGSGEAQRLTDGKLNETPYSISPDGKRLAFFQAPSQADLFTAAIESDPSRGSQGVRLGKAEVFLGTRFSELYPSFSPDGRWMAYASDESGTMEVYARPFPGPGGRWQISSGGGTRPVWSRSGHELLFQSPDRRVISVSYTVKGDLFTTGKTQEWPDVRLAEIGDVATFDLSPDGKHLAALLVVGTEAEKPLTHLMFLLNFFDEVRRRAPAGK